MAIIAPVSALGGVGRLASASSLSSIGSTAPVAALAGAGAGAALPGAPALGGTTPLSGSTPASGSTATDPAQGFLDTLGNAFGQLNQQLVTADASLADFAAGGSSDLHTVMLQMQEASLGLKLGVQVRDRFLEAYQEIMRLQL
jgi:flagellar hook-basal body complex protein FliE